jgi:hypothetical protein
MRDQGPILGGVRRGPAAHPFRLRILAAIWFLVASSLSGTSKRGFEIADSLEWMTWDSDLIVLGYPRSVTPDVIRTNDSVFEEQVTVDVKRVLYGSYNAGSLTFRWKTTRAKSMKVEVDLTEGPNLAYSRPQLFFLRRSDRQKLDDPVDWTLRRNVLINQSSQGLETLAGGGLARTAGEIMSVVEREAAYRAHNSLPVDVSSGPENLNRTKTLAQDCFECIAPRGAVMLRLSPMKYLVAPAYPRLQADALNLLQSVDVKERERGAFMLRSYPGEVTTRALMALLNDEGAYRWDMSPDTRCATYMVRAAAYDILREHGFVVPKPLLDECHNR